MITIEAIKAIEAINRLGSFAAAADELNKVRSALTYTVKTLEERLGVPLFDRSGYRAELTVYGRMLLEDGEQILASSLALEEKIYKKHKGLETAFSLAYDELIPFKNLIPLISAFTEQFPQTHLNIRSERLMGAWDALVHNKADFVIGLSNRGWEKIECKTFSLGLVEFVFAVSSDHPLAHTTIPITEDMVREYRSIAATDTSSSAQEKISTGILHNQPKITVDSFQNKLEAQMAGLGVGYLPFAWAKPYIDQGKLIALEGPALKSKAHLSIAWTHNTESQQLDWWVKHTLKHKDSLLT